MNWLERYILLERVNKDIESEKNHDDLKSYISESATLAWLELSSSEKQYLEERGSIASPEDLDNVPLPPNMVWGPINKKKHPYNMAAPWKILNEVAIISHSISGSYHSVSVNLRKSHVKVLSAESYLKNNSVNNKIVESQIDSNSENDKEFSWIEG